MTNIKQNRFFVIAKTKEQIFNINDLARIWGISNRQTLSITLKRYRNTGLIHRVYRGLYSLIPATELDPIILGAKAINDYCYLSGETILAKHGIIFQQINQYTFIGRRTKRFAVAGHQYYCRQLKDKFLFNDTGVLKRGRAVNEATPERAAADILHFNPRFHFDNPAALNQNKLKEVKQAVYRK